MALYQATNITPDLISGRENGIVFRNTASGAKQNIRWTVNGNSRLTAYRIQFFRNDANSIPGSDTGKVSLATPFSAVDADGNQTDFSVSLPYTYFFAVANADANKQGKYVITQYWGDGADENVVQRSASVFQLTERTTASVSRNDMDFTATVTLPSASTYGPVSVVWTRWKIEKVGENGWITVQDTGRVWGATDYSWTPAVVPPGTYRVTFSFATSNGEIISRYSDYFDVMPSTLRVNSFVHATCDHANQAVKVTVNPNETIPLSDYTTQDGKLILPAGGNMTVDVPQFSEDAPRNWALYWSGTAEDGYTGTLVEVRTANGNVFRIVRTGTGITFTPSPTERIDETFADGQQVNVGLQYQGVIYGNLWHIGMTDNGSYSSSAYGVSNVGSAYDLPVSITVYGSSTTSRLMILYGADAGTVVYDWVRDNTEPSVFPPNVDFTFGDVPGVSINPFGDWTEGAEVWRSDGGPALEYVGLFAVGESPIPMSWLDYTAVNGKEYTYYLYKPGTTVSQPIEAYSETVSPCFWDWALIEATERANGAQAAYVVQQAFFFGSNLTSGSDGNGSSPSVHPNFTQYPMVMRDSVNRHSGTITALLGGASSPGVYADTNAVRDALRALSTSPNPLFIRSRRGDVFRIAISGEITTAAQDNSTEQALTVTIPWVEVGPVEGLVVQDATEWPDSET